MAPCRSSRRRDARPAAGRLPTPRRCGSGSVRWTGLGSNATSANGKCGPSWATVSSVHRRRQTVDGLVEPGARVSPGRCPMRLPLRPQPARTGADDGTSVRHPVQRPEDPGGDEGVAQTEEVDVGPEPDGGRAGRQGRQHGSGVEELGRRAVWAGALCPRTASPPCARGKTRCSGSQADSKPRRSAASAASAHRRGCMRPKVMANFTLDRPGTAVKLPRCSSAHTSEPCGKNARWPASRTPRCPSTASPATR